MNLEEILEKVKKSEITNDSIGTKQEKTIHKVLKFYLVDDAKYHEIKIDNYFIDVYKDGMIYEIQTKSFNAIKNKLSNLLINHEVTIVYPLTIEKHIYIEDDNGELLRKRKSPKTGSPLIICSELYKIKSLLKSNNLHLMIVLLKTKERRFLRINRYHRTVSSRIDELPFEITSKLDFKTVAELSHLLPNTLPTEFTTNDLVKNLKLRKKDASLVANILYSTGALERMGKVRNCYLYKKHIY